MAYHSSFVGQPGGLGGAMAWRGMGGAGLAMGMHAHQHNAMVDPPMPLPYHPAGDSRDILGAAVNTFPSLRSKHRVVVRIFESL